MSDRQAIEAVVELINDYGVGLTGELRTRRTIKVQSHPMS